MRDYLAAFSLGLPIFRSGASQNLPPLPGPCSALDCRCINPQLSAESVKNSPLGESLSCIETLEMLGSPGGYCSFAYSALAFFRMGMSGSASFQSVRKSL